MVPAPTWHLTRSFTSPPIHLLKKLLSPYALRFRQGNS